MNATAAGTRVARGMSRPRARVPAYSDRFVENNVLSELPGLALALITLAYVVTSLVALV